MAFCSFLACEDALIEKPKSLTVEGFYNTPGEVETGLAAIYTPMRNRIDNWWMSMQECQTEYGGGLIGAANFDACKTMQGLDGVTSNNIIRSWDDFYSSIRNANLVIFYTSQSEVLSDAEKNVYLAEAKFLRALAYFHLTRAWGGLPIYTEENLYETTGAPKSSQEAVYALIRSDMEFAAQYLPEQVSVAGKPSKWAAKTALSDVYLYLEEYALAQSTALEVINSGVYALEPVAQEEDFYNLFGLTTASSEEIFYFKYNQNLRSSLVLFTQEINTPYFGSSGYGVFFWNVEHPFYTEWDDNDLRKSFNWYVTAETNRFLPGQFGFPQDAPHLCPKKYSDPAGQATNATFDFPVYRYAEVLLIYAEATAYVAGGPTAEAMESVNMVHRRAYGYDATTASPVDFNVADYDLASFVDLIIQERGYEFQFEGKRWFDLVRSGRVYENMKKYLDREVAEKHLLWPIPSIEFDLNEAMGPDDQNPGY